MISLYTVHDTLCCRAHVLMHERPGRSPVRSSQMILVHLTSKGPATSNHTNCCR